MNFLTLLRKMWSFFEGIFFNGKLFLFVGMLLLVAIIYPAIPLAGYHAPWSAIAARGRDIYIAITGANSDRKPLGLPPLWPKTYLAYTNHLDDVSAQSFKTSSDYFYELYDGSNAGTDQHDPYVRGFDYSKLAGAGVAAKYGEGKLTPANNMWLIAANLTDSDDDRIPVLITRNVDASVIERAINYGIKTNDFRTKIPLGKGDYKTPFGNKGFVCVRKGGGTFSNQSRYATLGILFNGQELPPRDPSKPPIVYLMP